MTGTTALQHRKVGLRLRSNIACHSSTVVSAIGLPPQKPPTRLTSASIRPNFHRVVDELAQLARVADVDLAHQQVGLRKAATSRCSSSGTSRR
jgi:hypothetical protein